MNECGTKKSSSCIHYLQQPSPHGNLTVLWFGKIHAGYVFLDLKDLHADSGTLMLIEVNTVINLDEVWVEKKEFLIRSTASI